LNFDPDGGPTIEIHGVIDGLVPELQRLRSPRSSVSRADPLLEHDPYLVPLKRRALARARWGIYLDMRRVLEDLIKLLDLEPIEVNMFRGVSPRDGWQRVFGGQVLGQALVAAGRTVEGRAAHSFHAYFLRPGDPAVPILYDVDRIRDGSSFTTRRVVAIQHGRAIFNLQASFQLDEPGLEHQLEMPADVPGPEGLKNERELRALVADRLPEKMRRASCATARSRCGRSTRSTSSTRSRGRPSRTSGSARSTRCPTTVRCTSACWPTRRT
jgi:hypothetical protein